MRVGEVLKITAMDVDDQKLTIKNPKSGKSREVVFIPKKLADRLKDYLSSEARQGTDNFPHYLILPLGSWSKRPAAWWGSTSGHTT